MSERLEAILAENYLGDLTASDMDDLRRRRVECGAVETGLSYVRRMVQGRLDVVAAERDRRAEGGGADDLEGLIARLPGLLAGSTRAPGVGRLPSDFGPGDLDDDLVAELDRIVTAGRLSEPGAIDDDSLDALAEQLTGFEQKVSALRRRLFDRLDAIEAEVARRYRTGEASVDSLLR